MFKSKIIPNYVSPLDQFLQEFDKQHPKLSASQQEEITAYRRIAALRDNPQQETAKDLFDF